MANVDIQLGYKDSAWFTNNATLVLKVGQTVHLQQTGTYKIGDGVTVLSVLSFLGNAASTELVVATVVNDTNVNLLKANYQAVRVSTAQGQRIAVELAQADNDNNSADTIGLVAQNINNNQEGLINILGQLTQINTTGNLQGETWADGDVLYLSATIAGQITNIKPTGLVGHLVVIGYVAYAHANNGKIYVKITNGFEIDELHNVYVNPTTLANNDVLSYESSSQLWKNKQVKDNIQMSFLPSSLSPADATTYFYCRGLVPNVNAANHAIKLGYNGIVTSAIIIAGTNTVSGSTENSTIQFRNITQATSTLISNTVKTNGSTTAIVSQTVTGLNIAFLGTDDFCIQYDAATYAINPTGLVLSVYLTIEKTS